MKRILTKNQIQCKHCKDIIESKFIHDLKFCKCKAVGVDGGLVYPKRIFTSQPPTEHYIDLSEYKVELL